MVTKTYHPSNICDSSDGSDSSNSSDSSVSSGCGDSSDSTDQKTFTKQTNFTFFFSYQKTLFSPRNWFYRKKNPQKPTIVMKLKM